MPALTGMPLSEVLAGQRGRIPIDVALGVIYDVALLIERAHGAGHVHGSLSPYAVWVASNGTVWVEWHPQKSPVARNLAPEIRHGEAPTGAADVYALSALGYELLTGLSISRAWAKQPLVNLQDVASARQFNAFVPPEVDAVISLGLSHNAAERPARIVTLARAAEGTAGAGGWRASLAELVADSFFAPALRELPVTCERAGAQNPRPHLYPPEPSLTQRLVAAEADLPQALLANGSANDDEESPSSMPMVKIMVATAVAAACSLALCLGLARVDAKEPVVMPAPAPVAQVAPPPPVPEPVVVAQAEPTPAPAEATKAKVKAERSRANKRGTVSHKRKR